MEKTKGIIQEFKDFISKGSVLDLAVGVIIGGAFKGIIDSLVNDIIMPLISALVGGLDFSNWFVSLDGSKYETLAAAKEAGAATLNYGTFLTVVINFLLMAVVIFFLVKGMNAMMKKRQEETGIEEVTTKVCPFCKSEISIEATRCPNCTSNLE